ncbi:N-acetylmuramoyl-L-alanine amidase [Pseudohoeflea suaedae]|nr:N-acetylmuramoyl-L-alanine amidase [Pseudohoeflea suaedae]
MRIDTHRLIGNDGAPVTFLKAAHSGGQIIPRFVVIHYTAGGSAEATARYFASDAARASAHFIISRDGAVIQQVPTDSAAWHAGKSSWQGLSGLNAHSIGIELANWGKLSRSPGGYASHTGTPVPASRVVLAAHRNAPDREEAWERFDAPQLAAAAEVATALLTAYGLTEDAIIGHDDIAPGRKIDPGPAFDMRAFRGAVAGRGEDGELAQDIRVVTAPAGLNLRTGPGIDFAPVALMPDGMRVRVVAPGAPWAFVAAREHGYDGPSGYAHTAWLRVI